jgi:hypothetical protein
MAGTCCKSLPFHYTMTVYKFIVQRLGSRYLCCMFYKLEEHIPVKCKDVLEWAEWAKGAEESRIVAQDEIDGFLVSTVFLGVDAGCTLGRNPPLLFETMTFVNGNATGITIRYATWREAEAGHRRMVLKARNGDMADA